MTTAPSDDLPRDRPALSISRGALAALAGLYCFWGLSPSILYFSLLDLTIGGDPIRFPVLIPILVVVIPLVPLLLGIRSGRRWALRLFRGMTWAGNAFVLASVLVGLLLVAGALPARRDQVVDAQFTLGVSLLLVPLGWWLTHRIRTVRWLDPLSRPSEWEPPARRGPRR